MSKLQDKPAFPRPAALDAGRVYNGDQPGMTLRQWYAGQALGGSDWGGTNPGIWPYVAQNCWRMADEMIKAESEGR